MASEEGDLSCTWGSSVGKTVSAEATVWTVKSAHSVPKWRINATGGTVGATVFGREGSLSFLLTSNSSISSKLLRNS